MVVPIQICIYFAGVCTENQLPLKQKKSLLVLVFFFLDCYINIYRYLFTDVYICVYIYMYSINIISLF